MQRGICLVPAYKNHSTMCRFPLPGAPSSGRARAFSSRQQYTALCFCPTPLTRAGRVRPADIITHFCVMHSIFVGLFIQLLPPSDVKAQDHPRPEKRRGEKSKTQRRKGSPASFASRARITSHCGAKCRRCIRSSVFQRRRPQ